MKKLYKIFKNNNNNVHSNHKIIINNQKDKLSYLIKVQKSLIQ